MGLEAGNPVVGGTVLRRAAIQSPNFLTGSTGWSINQDGSAEFNNLVIRNGQIVSGVALYYSGPPALNNLILAISATDGSDTHGNNFFAGVTMYNGHGAVVNLFSSARSAFFQYNDHGTAVQGSLILSVASTAGIDPVTGVGYNPGLIGTDPVFGSQMGVVGATINFNVGGTFSQTSLIQSQIGAGANSPYIALYAPEQGVSGHLVMLMQGTSPDGTHLGQFLIARKPTGFAVPVPATSSLLEIQSDASGLIDPLVTLTNQAAGDRALGVRVVGDTANRWLARSDGSHHWRNGASATDIKALIAPTGDTTGVQDLTIINNGLSSGHVVEMLPGQYFINGPISGPLDAALQAQLKKSVSIFLANGSNSRMLNLNGAGGRIAGIEFNGNGVNNASNSGIYFAAAASQPNWWSIEDCYIHDVNGTGLDLANGCGEAAKINGCWIFNCGSFGIDIIPSDVVLLNTLIGMSFTDNVRSQGAVTHILGCDIYSSQTGNGITMNWGVGGNGIGSMIANCGIDRNAQHGIVCLSPSIAINGNSFHSNSQNATNVFDSIVLDDTAHPGLLTGITIGGNTFWLDAGITVKPKYHIEYKNTANAKTHGNGFQPGSFGTGTISGPSLAKDINETG